MLFFYLERGGVVAWALLATSVAVVTLILERIDFWRRNARTASLYRGEPIPGADAHEHTLRPLAEVATSLGLLGTVLGMVSAYNGFKSEGIDFKSVINGLATAGLTTIFGMIVAIMAAVACYFFNLCAQRNSRES